MHGVATEGDLLQEKREALKVTLRQEQMGVSIPPQIMVGVLLGKPIPEGSQSTIT